MKSFTKTMSAASFLALGLSSIAFAVSTAHAETQDKLGIKVGDKICGHATLNVDNKFVTLSNFVTTGNCQSLGGTGDGTGDGTGTGTGTGDAEYDAVLATGRLGSNWENPDFPKIIQSFHKVNVKTGDSTNKFVYFKIDSEKFGSVDYQGNISLITTTSSFNSTFAAWVSSKPGGEPISPQCTRAPSVESTIFFSTSYKKAPQYACKIDVQKTLYLNVSDRSYDDLKAGKVGDCKAVNTKGCEFGIGVKSSVVK